MERDLKNGTREKIRRQIKWWTFTPMVDFDRGTHRVNFVISIL